MRLSLEIFKTNFVCTKVLMESFTKQLAIGLVKLNASLFVFVISMGSFFTHFQNMMLFEMRKVNLLMYTIVIYAEQKLMLHIFVWIWKNTEMEAENVTDEICKNQMLIFLYIVNICVHKKQQKYSCIYRSVVLMCWCVEFYNICLWPVHDVHGGGLENGTIQKMY